MACFSGTARFGWAMSEFPVELDDCCIASRIDGPALHREFAGGGHLRRSYKNAAVHSEVLPKAPIQS